MKAFTQDQWSKLLKTILSQLNSDHCSKRIKLIRNLSSGFEGWLLLEVVNAAKITFENIDISINEHFEGINKLDLGLKLNDSCCAIELKHIPTNNSNAYSRFIKGKPSTVVKDFNKLYNTNDSDKILRKILILYGSEGLHSVNCLETKTHLYATCLQCIMKEFIKEIGMVDINWQNHSLSVPGMSMIEISI